MKLCELQLLARFTKEDPEAQRVKELAVGHPAKKKRHWNFWCQLPTLLAPLLQLPLNLILENRSHLFIPVAYGAGRANPYRSKNSRSARPGCVANVTQLVSDEHRMRVHQGPN